MSILKNQFQKQWFQKHWFQKLRLHDQTHPLSISQIYINERAGWPHVNYTHNFVIYSP